MPDEQTAEALVRAWELPMHEQFRPVGYAREQLVSAIAAALSEARASAEGKARAEERERCARVCDDKAYAALRLLNHMHEPSQERVSLIAEVGVSGECASLIRSGYEPTTESD